MTPDIEERFPRVGKHIARRLKLRATDTITVQFADEDVCAWRDQCERIEIAFAHQPHLRRQKEAALEQAAKSLAECVILESE